jgi:hypothetical protein
MKKSLSALLGSGLLLCGASLFAQTGGGTSGTGGGERPAKQEKPKVSEKAKAQKGELKAPQGKPKAEKGSQNPAAKAKTKGKAEEPKAQ